MSNEDVEKLLFDTQRIYSESNKIKDKIIIMLIVLMFLEAVAGLQVLYGTKASLKQCRQQKKQKQRM